MHDSVTTPPTDHIAAFRSAMEAAGIIFADAIVADGTLHYIHIDGHRKGSLKGWYVLHLDGRPAGAFGDFKAGIKSKWTAAGATKLSREDRAALAAKMRADRERQARKKAARQHRAAVRANAIWNAAAPAPDDHPYLARKGVPAYGLRVADWPYAIVDKETGKFLGKGHIPDALLVPIRTKSKEIVSLQAIFPTKDTPLGTDKYFLPGGEKKGNYFVIGRPIEIDGKPTVAIVEGCATGAEIHRDTGIGVIIAFDADNVPRVAKMFREHYPDMQIVVCADNDRWTGGNPGVTRATEAARAVSGILAVPQFEKLDTKPSDFNDLCTLDGREEVKRQIMEAIRGGAAGAEPARDPPDAAEPEPGRELALTTDRSQMMMSTLNPSWKAELIVPSDGNSARPILANAIHILRNHPEVAGVFGFDDFAKRTVFLKAPPWSPRAKVHAETEIEVSNFDVLAATEWMQRSAWLFVKDNIVSQAIETVAREHTFHPVRDYLNSLMWDGRPRIDRWLVDAAGASDSEIIRQMSGKFLLSAVARIFDPGCKVDTMLVLEGEQGLKKSSALKALAAPWFTDHLPDLTSKDAAIQLQGKWLIEIAEMTTINRADVTRIKSFLSSQVDRFRPPHAKFAEDFPRQCVFAGTVNPEGGYLRDATGSRRFWTIACTRTVDVDALRRDRDQIWAGRWDQATQNVAARALVKMGWTRRRDSRPDQAGKRQWRYYSPTPLAQYELNGTPSGTEEIPF